LRLIYLILFLFLLTACPPKDTLTQAIPDEQNEKEICIAFGSCNKHDEPQPLWSAIANENPALWIWLGDIVYGDTENMSLLKKKYQKQKEQTDYAAFIKEVPQIIGVWDDHDYGENDGDKSYPQKAASRDLALEFLDVPKSAEVWKREGLYQSHLIQHQDLSIRIILLDGRYFRDKIKRKKGVYEKKDDAELLGEEQWKWLEKELAKEEDLLIIGSGIQVIPEEHRFEKWANFPSERKRLFNLLKDENAKQIVLISGDRHIGEISRVRAGKQTIYEVTSSGLTHSYEEVGKEENRHRISKLTGELNYGLITINEQREILLSLVTKDRRRIDQIKISKSLK